MFYVPSPESNDSAEITGTGNKSEVEHSSHNYETELQILHEKNVSAMRNYVIAGNLRSSKMRSIFWRILLGIFPISPTADWLNAIRESRKCYNHIKSNFTLDPRQTSDLPDDNPLSQDKNSIWYRYFCDKELKRIIRQDVVRTSPEKQFFQSSPMQEMMINILFLYARQNPEICYRQGMHEILAPILYVFHEDYNNFNSVKSESVMHTTLSEIMDSGFLEHDVFNLFSLIMSRMEQYYQIGCVPNASGHLPAQENSNQIAVTGDHMGESEISLYLNELRDKLQKYDRQLHDHLKLLNIPFTTFGIRWLRLLFGREFSFSDLFILWDAIFSVDSDFVLVSYVVIAMLIVIREKILNSDYMQCLNYLMKYPNTVDVMYVIKYAMYLKEPMVYEQPRLPVTKNTEVGSTQLPIVNVHPNSNNHNNISKQTKSITKRLKNIKINSVKKSPRNNEFNHVIDYSSETMERMVSELKHMRVVMSLCKLKLYQYHEILTTSVPEDDIKAQHALTGIHELCSLLDIDHFALKSSPNGSVDIETGREAGEISVRCNQDNTSCLSHPTIDAIAMYLPPPNTDIDMTIFKQSECKPSDMKGFPLENPLRLDKSEY